MIPPATTWQEAARGIEPWPGARLVGGGIVLFRDGDTLMVQEVRTRPAGPTYSLPQTYDRERPHPPLDLADPDTRAAFDRRLALRLGAPPEWADEALCVTVHNENLYVEAGLTPKEEYIDYAFRWSEVVQVDTDDPLLARALAWRSVA